MVNDRLTTSERVLTLLSGGLELFYEFSKIFSPEKEQNNIDFGQSVCLVRLLTESFYPFLIAEAWNLDCTPFLKNILFLNGVYLQDCTIPTLATDEVPPWFVVLCWLLDLWRSIFIKFIVYFHYFPAFPGTAYSTFRVIVNHLASHNEVPWMRTLFLIEIKVSIWFLKDNTCLFLSVRHQRHC